MCYLKLIYVYIELKNSPVKELSSLNYNDICGSIYDPSILYAL